MVKDCMVIQHLHENHCHPTETSNDQFALVGEYNTTTTNITTITIVDTNITNILDTTITILDTTNTTTMNDTTPSCT